MNEKSHDALIERLRQLDQRHAAPHDLPLPQSLVQRVVQSSVIRRRRRRRKVVALSGVGMAAMVFSVMWRSQPDYDSRIAQANHSLATESHEPSEQQAITVATEADRSTRPSKSQSADFLQVDVQTIAAPSQPLSAAESPLGDDTAMELERLKRARVELLKQLDEVQSQIRRAELTQQILNETEIPQELFY